MSIDPGSIQVSSLGWGSVALLAVAAGLTGFAKTAVGGVGLLSVAVFAGVLPSRASTGVLLPLLLVGDLVAVRAYRAHADWPTLLRLLPAVAAGMLAGVVFVSRVDDTVMRRAIGAVLIVLLALQLAGRFRGAARPVTDVPQPVHRLAAWGFGSLSGFTTMVANAGGPAMSLYLLAARFSVLGFMGTTSWFFFVINILKVPFSVGLGLITPASLLLDLALAPAVLAGAWIGRSVLTRIEQNRFEQLVLVTTLLAGLNLLR